MTAPSAVRFEDAASVVAALATVADPEIPAASIVDLGMIGNVRLSGATIEVELLPTFIGCPAIELIRTSIAERLAEDGRTIRVDVSFSTPWTSDRISARGREQLARSGFAPPPPMRPGRGLPMLDVTAEVEAPVACPFCGSLRTTLESPFGPTQCRTIRHCADCRQPFEAFKPI